MAELIYLNNKDKIVTISANNNKPINIDDESSVLNIQSVFGSGWIQDVIDERIIVVTCAHLVLQDDGVELPIIPKTSISCTVTNAIPKGEKIGKNIAVSLKILGMDISADIAVLYSLKECEENTQNPFTFNFSSRNETLEWGNSSKVTFGSNVYVISNAYGTGLSMTTGTIADNDLVFRTLDPTYPNSTSQMISSVDVANGSSGSPVFSPDGKIIGIVSWRKIDGGNFVGGANQHILENSYNKIIKLNSIGCNIDNAGINFQGSNGKGFLGISSYFSTTDQTLKYLVKTFPSFANSKYYNSANGIVLVQFSPTPIVIPKSCVINAKNLETGVREGLQQFDIILEINGVSLGVYDKNVSLDDFSYYFANKKVNMKILRPSTSEIICYSVINDEYPSLLEYVSQNSSIELIGGATGLSQEVFSGGTPPYPLYIKFLTYNSSPTTPPQPPFNAYATSFQTYTKTGGPTSEIINILVDSGTNGFPINKAASYCINYVVLVGGKKEIKDPITNTVIDNVLTYKTPLIYAKATTLPIPNGPLELPILPLVFTEPIFATDLNPDGLPQTYKSSGINNPFGPLYGSPTIPGSVPFALRLSNFITFSSTQTSNILALSFELTNPTNNQTVSQKPISLANNELLVLPNNAKPFIIKYITLEKQKINIVGNNKAIVDKISKLYILGDNDIYYNMIMDDPFVFLLVGTNPSNSLPSTYSLPLPEGF